MFQIKTTPKNGGAARLAPIAASELWVALGWAIMAVIALFLVYQANVSRTNDAPRGARMLKSHNVVIAAELDDAVEVAHVPANARVMEAFAALDPSTNPQRRD